MRQGFVWTGSTGKVRPLATAAIPWDTPGVMFGESVFETLRVRRGSVFRFDHHVTRLQGSVRGLGWGTPPTAQNLKTGLGAVVQASMEAGHFGPEGDLRVRMTVLRLDDGGSLDVVIQALPYTPPSPAQYEAGVDAIIASVRLDATALVYRFKTGNRLLFRQAAAQARATGAWEGLLLNTKGKLADGSISNLHIVEKGRIFAPSVHNGALPGIAQRILRECAASSRIPWTWGALSPSRLAAAEEAFLTNALIGVLPLVRVDGLPLGSGQSGPITRMLQEVYTARVAVESVPISQIS